MCACLVQVDDSLYLCMCLILIAFITGNSSLEPLIEGLCTLIALALFMRALNNVYYLKAIIWYLHTSRTQFERLAGGWDLGLFLFGVQHMWCAERKADIYIDSVRAFPGHSLGMRRGMNEAPGWASCRQSSPRLHPWPFPEREQSFCLRRPCAAPARNPWSANGCATCSHIPHACLLCQCASRPRFRRCAKYSHRSTHQYYAVYGYSHRSSHALRANHWLNRTQWIDQRGDPYDNTTYYTKTVRFVQHVLSFLRTFFMFLYSALNTLRSRSWVGMASPREDLSTVRL